MLRQTKAWQRAMLGLALAFATLGPTAPVCAEVVAELQTRVLPNALLGEFFFQVPLRQLFFAQQGDSCVAQAEVRISLWNEQGVEVYRAQYTRAWSFAEDECTTLNLPPDYTLSKTVPLAPGLYRYEVALTDLHTGQTFMAAEQGVDVDENAPNGVMASSLRLSAQDPTHHGPVFGHRLPAGTTHLFCALDVWNPTAHPLALRAMLFQKAATQALETATYYTNISQVSGVLPPRGGTRGLAFPFLLENLPPGEYRVEVYILSGDTVVAKRARAFDLTWQGLADVYAHLPTAIAQLGPIATPEAIRQLLSLPDPSQQRQAFDAFWLSRLGEADAQNPAERISRYYRSIYAADTLFAEPNQDGWTTHRGTCFLQMGMPQRILYQEAGGDSLQFWHYPHFSLWVGFQRDAQGRWLRLPQS